MQSSWAPLQAVLNEGSRFVLKDQQIWLGPIEEFGMECRISKPLKAELEILPQEDGLFIRGSLTGQVIMPCNLCAEDAACDLEHTFESFEPFPEDEHKRGKGDEAKIVADSDVDEYFIRQSPLGTGLEINLGALLWEEFAQAMPMHPLCSSGCAGLCSHCGHNLNQGPCGCLNDNQDPRLSKLRGLKIN